MKMKNIYLTISIVFACLTSNAQVDRSKMPEPGPAPKIELGKTETFTLDNGLKVFVVENTKLPRVTFSLEFDIDPFTEGDKVGTADLAGDMLSKGTSNRTKDELNFEIDFIGASFGTSANSIYGRSLKKHQEKLLEIMSDVVLNTEMKQEELDKLKKQYMSGIQTEKDDPDAIARNVRKVLLYGKDHPYGEIMTEETLENIDLEDVNSYYKTYIKPNISYLAVVGDIKVKDAKKLVKKYFGEWKRGDVPSKDYAAPSSNESMKIAFVNKPGAVQSVVSIFNTIDLKPGSEDDIAAGVANGILGGGFTSKLNLNLREQHSYTYGARSSINSDELVGNFYASAKVRNEVTDSAITEAMKEINGMVNGNITDEELTTIKNYRTGVFAANLESPQTIAGFAVNTEKYGLDEAYYQNYLKNLAAVDLEKTKMVSKKYIKPQSGYILIVGNQEEVLDKVKALNLVDQIEFYDAYGNSVEETTMKAAPAGITAESVVNNYLAAIGGREKLAKVNTLKTVMSTTMQGMPISIETYNKGKDKYSSTVGSNGMVFQKMVINGDKGQISGMQGSKPLEGEELESQKIEANPFQELNYTQEGYQLELLGVDTKMDQEVYVVQVTKPSGDKQTEYYSVETSLLIMTIANIETPNGPITDEKTLFDYKEVEGIKFASRVKQVAGPQAMDLNVETIEVNKPIEDAVFAIE